MGMRSTATRPDRGDDALERGLVERIARRDREAFDQLFRHYHPQLFRFAYRLTSSYGLAEEVASDVLMIVWQKADGFRGDSRVSTWIFGIAYRCSLKGLRRKKHKWVPIRDVDVVDRHADSRVERGDWVDRAIDGLPAEQKLTVLLVYYVGLTCEETAEVTGVPAGTVRTRMFHARKKLQATLEKSALPVGEKGTT